MEQQKKQGDGQFKQYEINDPRYDAAYVAKTEDEIKATAEKIGATGYDAVTDNNQRVRFVKDENEWRRQAGEAAREQSAEEIHPDQVGDLPNPAGRAGQGKEQSADLKAPDATLVQPLSPNRDQQKDTGQAAKGQQAEVQGKGDPTPEAVENAIEQELKRRQAATAQRDGERFQENQLHSDEMFTATQHNPGRPILPPDMERDYVEVDGKYYSVKSPDNDSFEDKGNRLQTKSENAHVAANLVRIAEARGWDEIKVSGTQNFRRDVWLEAAARGMQVKGYEPSEQDKAALAAKLKGTEADAGRERMAKDFRARENLPSQEIRERQAEAFQKETREAALKKFPELAGAYAAKAAIERKLEADRLTERQRLYVQQRVMERLTKSIQEGRIPQVRRREEVTLNQKAQPKADTTRSEDRDLSR